MPRLSLEANPDEALAGFVVTTQNLPPCGAEAIKREPSTQIYCGEERSPSRPRERRDVFG